MASSLNKINTTISQHAIISNYSLQLATINKNQNQQCQPSEFDKQIEVELLVLFQQYFGKDPKYREVAAKLQEALEANQVLPPRYDFEGNPHPQTLAAFLKNVGIYANSLPEMFQCLSKLQSKYSPPPIRGLPIRLFTSHKTALDRKANENVMTPPSIQSVICARPSINALKNMHPLKFLKSREFGGRTMPLLPKQIFRKEFMQLLNRQIRIMGHLSSIFCVAFDRSGRYIFTGADDNLIKCWDAQQFLLRFTFRGHIGEISELSISHENSMLGSGSVDKTVRIWSLRNGATIRVFKGHSATINSIAFIPLIFAGSDSRWLVTAGNDCAVIFHRYNERTKKFFEPPQKFNERASGGARIISSSHSPGGNIVIIGDTHQAIILYKLSEHLVDRLCEFTAHSDRVDTLAWAHHSLRFASGSKDGTAKVWTISGGQWTSTELIIPKSETTIVLADELQKKTNASSQTPNKKNVAQQNASYKVTMLTWSLEDDMIVSIGSDYLLRTWDWKTGRMLGKYAGHQNETYSLVAHPLHRELVVSGGHDGLMIVWNIYTGKQICYHRNMNNNREAVAIFDMAIGPDGATVGFVDSLGCLSIYSVITNNQFAMMRPREQFFSTDYRLLQIDPDGRATDEDTGLLPEQLSPSFFVTAEGNLHPEKEQRLVPGNDILSEDIIKTCAWLKRDIVEPLPQSILQKYKAEQIEHCLEELIEFERGMVADANLQPPHPVQKLIIPVVEQRAIRHRPRTNPNANTPFRIQTRRSMPATEFRQLADSILQQQNQPRYLLDEDYTDDEDRSFSLGSDEDEREFIPRENAANRQRQPQLAAADDESTNNDENESDDEEDEGEVIDNGEEDENDSDFELGRSEHVTVFRERSTWTVTGRRKRRLPGNEQQEQNDRLEEQQQQNRYRSERLRARATAAAALASQQQQHPSSSSAALPHHQTAFRRIKTRQMAAFIASSDEEDIEPKKEERKRVKRRRKRKHIQKRIHQIEQKEEEEEESEDELESDSSGNEEESSIKRTRHHNKRKLTDGKKQGYRMILRSAAGANSLKVGNFPKDNVDDDSKSYRSRLRTRAVLTIRDDPTQPSSSSAPTIMYTSSGRRIRPTQPQWFASSSKWDEEDDWEDEPQTIKKKRRII